MTASTWCTARWLPWREGRRRVHPCDRCPVEAACTAPLPGPALTLAAVAEHGRRLDAALARVLG